MIKEMEEFNYYQEGQKIARKKSLGKRIFFSLIFLLFLFFLAYGAFLFYKIYATGKTISISTQESAPSFFETAKSLVAKDEINLKNIDGRINILFLGIAGQGKAGTNLTDTLMLMSLNMKTGQVALLSIPRDLFVTIPEMEIQTKINSVYQIGLRSESGSKKNGAETIVSTVEKILAEKINYFAILDYTGFEKIINSLGGVNVMNERDIYDDSYPGPNYSYETFALPKGFHKLDGATALKYVRERHSDPEGDFGRAKRQQQVLQSAKNRIFSPEVMFNVVSLNNLFNALGENLVTNIQADEIKSFYNLSKKLDTQNINNVVVDAWNKDSLLKVSHVLYGNINAFVLVPRLGNWSEVQELADNMFDLNKIKRRQAEIEKENASIAIVNRSGDSKVAETIRKILTEGFSYGKVSLLKDVSSKIEKETFAYDLAQGNKPFTLDEIITRLPAKKASGNFLGKLNSSEKYDLIVVIGKDLVSQYNREEGTLEDLNNERDNQEMLDFVKN